MINKNENVQVVKHTEIIVGRMQSLELNINDKHIMILNVYGPNNDDVHFFETLETFVRENEDKNIIIGGDFNTVLNPDIDKKNGNIDTHKKCRNKLNSFLDSCNFCDIWRVFNPDKKQYTWHSNSKPPIFCRLDFFLISNHMVNFTSSCSIKSGYKSDHSIVTLTLSFNKSIRGPGYFKLNNSLLLQTDYQHIIKHSINETVLNNKDSNPNTLWEIIKGNIRNETIKFASHKKKTDITNENNLNLEIEKIEHKINSATNNENIDELKKQLDENKTQLNSIIDNKINGIIIRSKATMVEFNEKNSRYFSNLEKKRAESKVINQLKKMKKL